MREAHKKPSRREAKKLSLLSFTCLQFRSALEMDDRRRELYFKKSRAFYVILILGSSYFILTKNSKKNLKKITENGII